MAVTVHLTTLPSKHSSSGMASPSMAANSSRVGVRSLLPTAVVLISLPSAPVVVLLQGCGPKRGTGHPGPVRPPIKLAPMMVLSAPGDGLANRIGARPSGAPALAYLP